MAKDFAIKFYRSKLWRDTRQHALTRDHYTCQRCGGRAGEVHHIVELTPTNIDDYRVALSLDNLESLCRDCHNLLTQRGADVTTGYFFDTAGNVVKR